jgi:hypothetical protein
MGRAKGSGCKAGGASPRGRGSQLPEVIPAEAARAWRELAPIIPRDLYLAGGTAVAARLHHRESRDLDFFYHEDAVDLEELQRALENTGKFAVTGEAPGTLRGLYDKTKVEFLHADLVRPQKLIKPTDDLAGLRVASLPDLAAMKLKVIGDRGELRDYFDLKVIEQVGGLTIEDGFSYFLERFNVSREHESVTHIIRGLGYLEDVDEDEMLPAEKSELAAWWKARQARLVKNLSRDGW